MNLLSNAVPNAIYRKNFMNDASECRLVYCDDTLSFCLEHGTSLVYGVYADEPARRQCFIDTVVIN